MKEFLKKSAKLLLRLPILLPLAACYLLLSRVTMLSNLFEYNVTDLETLTSEAYFATLLISAFFVLPVILTVENILFALFSRKHELVRKAGVKVEIVTLVLGTVYSVLWTVGMSEIRWADWEEQLVNEEVHMPIATWTVPTIIVLALIGLTGYVVLRLNSFNKLPPLVSVLAAAALYIGMALNVMFIIQLAANDILLCVLPFNVIVISLKLLYEVVAKWREGQEKLESDGRLRRMMMNSSNWPWIAAVVTLPLLGVVVMLFTLFGQRPDSIIQAWTQTSDWTFSQQVAPQNIIYDEHYLCTVAAGGHRKVVKPLRYGKRHGHQVIVNRQLCVANAFEQLLEERTPRMHRVIRYIYDKYGYPIAKHINSKYVADAVWFIMKPLEWLFLITLYLFDSKPENRIAVQYPHAPLPER